MNTNYIAIIISAAIFMGLGYLWYSPILFGKPWMKMIGMTEKSMADARSEMGKTYGLMLLGALVMNYVLAQFVHLVGATTVTDGAGVGFWVWLGFIATFAIGGVTFEGRPWKLYLINVGYYLVALVITGGLLAVWK